ncbi:MAG: AgmX/PglI C-terminal domain-containing protein [Gammaproteobacteria bacterium]|nr:AgmX/PglI C-terminal domain-containing protein [Gammaproteobacteria bacterium]
MSTFSQSVLMPWELSAEVDARFHRIVITCMAVFLLLAVVMPYLPLPEIISTPVEESKPRLATLIFEVKPEPPKPVQKPKPPEPEKQVKAQKPVPKKPVPPKVVKATPKPAPVKPKVSARKQAEQAGLLAMKDALADMRQNTVTNTLKKTSNLSQAGGKARSTDRAVLTSGTTRSSGGIQTASLSRNTGGGQLAGRATTQVHSPSGNAPRDDTARSSRGERSAGRSIEEIQMVFDRNKGAIFSVYNRALRKDPSLQGKVVLELTIAPSGKVTRCVLVSSELQDAVLGKKISQRVKLFNFEAKDVSEVTITYPIEFLPA